MAFFLALTPWPYADISPQLDSHVATRDFRRYNLVEPVMKPDNMTMEELQSELHRATGHFFYDKFKNLSSLTPREAHLHGAGAEAPHREQLPRRARCARWRATRRCPSR